VDLGDEAHVSHAEVIGRRALQRDDALDITIAIGGHEADAIDDELRVVLQQRRAMFLERAEHQLVDLRHVGDRLGIHPLHAINHLRQSRRVQTPHPDVVVNFLERDAHGRELFHLHFA